MSFITAKSSAVFICTALASGSSIGARNPVLLDALPEILFSVCDEALSASAPISCANAENGISENKTLTDKNKLIILFSYQISLYKIGTTVMMYWQFSRVFPYYLIYIQHHFFKALDVNIFFSSSPTIILLSIQRISTSIISPVFLFFKLILTSL